MPPFEITDKIIQEIADELDCGLLVYIHKTTGEKISVPDYDNFYSVDESILEEDEELKKLEENFMDYYRIDKPESFESFRFMEDFIEIIDNKRLSYKLVNALNKRKPFREFKYVIDNSGEYRQIWFDYKAERMQEWVRNELKYAFWKDDEDIDN